MKRIILLGNTVWLALLIFSLASCSKNSDPLINEEEITFIALNRIRNEYRFGHSDEEAIGSAFQLPKGLHLAQRPHPPFDPALYKLQGLPWEDNAESILSDYETPDWVKPYK